VLRAIIEDFIYATGSAYYVPQMLKDVNKEARKATATDFLRLYGTGGKDFQPHTDIRDET
jgi:hypothetical protein